MYLFHQLSVPARFNSQLPVGLQIIAPEFSVGRVLNTSYAIEQMNPLQGKRTKLK